MTGVEINQYHIGRVQMKVKEAFQDAAQKAKHQQDFINNFHKHMTVVEDVRNCDLRSPKTLDFGPLTIFGLSYA